MLSFSDLKSTYDDFHKPVVQVLVNGKEISADKKGFTISDIYVDLTCGYEASVAEFMIYNTYDELAHEFKFDGIKKYILMGSPVVINVGYQPQVREVFRGFISQVNFVFRKGGIPGIEVHAMDIKGIMMANCYVKQIKATSYSEAVNSILSQPFYEKLKGSDSVYNDLSIADTPDKQQGGGNETTDKTIEMVAESDYEFVVKAAKKFNFEFFQSGDMVLFRKAKSDTQSLIQLGPETGMIAFEIGYDITGLVGSVEVRTTDPGKGTMVKATQKNKNKMSAGNKVKPLVSKQMKVYIDPTAASKQEADYRAQYLIEQANYRLGTLEADIVGLPELIPGKFVDITGLGTGPSNTFYVQNVRHSLDTEGGYQTHISGRAATVK